MNKKSLILLIVVCVLLTTVPLAVVRAESAVLLAPSLVQFKSERIKNRICHKLNYQSRLCDASNDTLNNLYYETIMKDIYDNQGIPDFEPTKADIGALIKTNKTKRSCVWAGENENCDY